MGFLGLLIIYAGIGFVFSSLGLIWEYKTAKTKNKKVTSDDVSLLFITITIMWPLCVVFTIAEGYVKFLKYIGERL